MPSPDIAAVLIERFVRRTRPWLLSDEPELDAAAWLGDALWAHPSAHTRAVDLPPRPALLVPGWSESELLVRLARDELERCVLLTLLLAERCFLTYRALGRLGVATVTRIGERALSLRFLRTALSEAEPGGGPADVEAAVDRLTGRGLVRDALGRTTDESVPSLHLPLPLLMYAAAPAAPPADLELAPGLLRHARPPAQPPGFLDALGLDPVPARLVVEDLELPDAVMLAGALVPVGPLFSLEAPTAAEPTWRLARALVEAEAGALILWAARSAALPEPWLRELAQAPTGRARILFALPAGSERRQLGEDVPRLGGGTLALTALSIGERDAEGGAGPAVPCTPALWQLAHARTPLQLSALSQGAPELAVRCEAALHEAAARESGLAPLRHPAPAQLLGPQAQQLLDEVIAFADGQGALRGAFGPLLPSGLVVELKAEDPGLLSAAVVYLAESLGRLVLRMDSGRVVSRYIGEAEQNLKRQLAAAERVGAVLYLPAADSLLGRRLAVTGTGERYSNQQVNYLLQRLDSFTGMLVFSTDRPQDLEPALRRRVLFVVELPPLTPETRAGYLRWLLPVEAHGGIDPVAAQPMAVHELELLALDALVLARARGEAPSSAHLGAALQLRHGAGHAPGRG